MKGFLGGYALEYFVNALKVYYVLSYKGEFISFLFDLKVLINHMSIVYWLWAVNRCLFLF